MNKFDQLVEDLKSGAISPTMIEIALRAYYRESKVVPVEMKGIICGQGEGDSGLIGKTFGLMRSTIGGMELAVRRAKDG